MLMFMIIFFIRKLKCSAQIQLSFYNEDRLIKIKSSKAQYSSYEKFAFSPKISFCVESVLLEAFGRGVEGATFSY